EVVHDLLPAWTAQLHEEVVTMIHNVDHQPLHLCVAKPGNVIPFNFPTWCDDLHVRVITSSRARNLSRVKVIQHRIAKAVPRDQLCKSFAKVASSFRSASCSGVIRRSYPRGLKSLVVFLDQLQRTSRRFLVLRYKVSSNV